MRYSCFRLTLPLLAALFLVWPACRSNTHEKKARAVKTIVSLDDTLSLESACRKVSTHLGFLLRSGDTALPGRFFRALDSTAREIKESVSGPKGLFDSIQSTVFGSWNIGFDPVDTAIETLLPHLVFRNQKGACLGVSLIVLLLAEKLNCPVYGVMLPGHFFCRYDNGKVRINMEPNRRGFEHPDDYYRRQYPVKHRPWYDLANLDKKAVIGVLCYNCGALCLRHNRYDAAIGYYQECLRRIPGFVEAKGNLALCYAKKSELDTALVLFEELFAVHPDLVNLAANYGAVAAAARQYPRAYAIYTKGLEYWPNDTLLKKRIEKTRRNFAIFPKKNIYE